MLNTVFWKDAKPLNERKKLRIRQGRNSRWDGSSYEAISIY
jgi:hypothetical protein